MASEDRDFLDEIIAEATAKNPAFPAMVEAASEQRRLEREAAARRERLGYTEQGIAEPVRSNAGRVLPRPYRPLCIALPSSGRQSLKEAIGWLFVVENE